MSGAVRVSAAIWPSQEWLRVCDSLGWWFFLPLAFLLTFAVFIAFFYPIPKEVRRQIAVVDSVIQKADLTKTERKEIWKKIIEKHLQGAPPDLKSNEELMQGRIVE
jgi:hypothetical protein